jgi:hypothetical protein
MHQTMYGCQTVIWQSEEAALTRNHVLTLSPCTATRKWGQYSLHHKQAHTVTEGHYVRTVLRVSFGVGVLVSRRDVSTAARLPQHARCFRTIRYIRLARYRRG